MKIKIFYNEKQQVNNNTSFSPSAGKPAKVLTDWMNHNIPLSVEEVRPLNRAEISLAHDLDYVQGVLSLRRTNGFGNTLKEVADSLYWTTGSLASAARYAIKNKSQAVSLTSGFHHAGHASGGGFCTFNGLVITAQMLKLHGYLKRGQVGILDLDQHYGNGTDNIISTLKLDYIKHFTLGGSGYHSSRAEEFIKNIPKLFKDMFKKVDILIYQAGADSCIDDPLGGVFTQDQMRRRDRAVFEQCKKYGIPVVWNLAGGYQDRFENVLAIHRATAEEHLNVFYGIEMNTGCETDYIKPEKVIYQMEDDHDDITGLSDESSWEDDINWETISK